MNYIVSAFLKMCGPHDLASLLERVYKEKYGEGYYFRGLNKFELLYFVKPQNRFTAYNTFEIKKKSGGCRIIHSPAWALLDIQKALNIVFQHIYTPHDAATGFVPGKSIIDNARPHLGKNYVYNLDLKDFFHSFDLQKVKWGLMYAFPNLKENEYLAYVIASLCTLPLKSEKGSYSVLPQGAPTSPTISNILCQKLDRRLSGLAKRFGATYSRYADDITFSSNHNIYKEPAFQQELKRIIEADQKLVINPQKTRLQKAGYRQEVTGLTVNEKINVPRRYIKEIRMYLYYWEQYGFDRAVVIFSSRLKNHGRIVRDLALILEGKLNYLKMVKGVADPVYLKLWKRFIKLHPKIGQPKITYN